MQLQRGDLASIEVHDHDRGRCDINDHDRGYRPRRCHREFQYTGTNVCCCRMCHSSDYPDRTERQRRRRERRKQRQDDRALSASADIAGAQP